MKKLILVFLILLNINVGYCADYSKIDKQSGTVPSSMKTAGEIAHYLTQNLSSPTDKTRAIYYWISHNIRYNLDKLNSTKVYTNTKEIVDETLQNRQGVCQNYAELFHACCESIGIKSYVISGYTNQKGELANYGHAWNAVLIDAKYYEIDATWAAGHIENGKYKHEFNDEYFLVSPAEFIKTHIPFDPIWQFSNNPITHKEFEKSDFSKLKTSSNFNFKDSIKVLSGLNPLEKAIRENRRITQFGLTNTLIRKQVYYNQQLIISEKYNLAVDLFNKGVAEYNNYMMYKNKQFKNTSMPDEQILGFLSSARQQVESAESFLNFLNSDNSDLNRMTRDMQSSIYKMKKDLQKEDAFMIKYIKTPKAFRIFLFVTVRQ